ncbi:hypothetical protein RND71_001422 [Anisodus tanguticus]|uniref:Protein phosphatase n=1 Tax=Anisodus tanguticus TaxID=243964 RepID=A0AAE1T076_9SOLA|nr:hypothetical protein RND71_001422 [Anisodus tanguticus]
MLEKLSPSFDIIDEYDNKDTTNNITGRMIMVAGSFYIPKHIEEKPLGEDAIFICEKEQTIGVADGVGGWAKKRGLLLGRLLACKHIEAQIETSNTTTSIDVMKVLNEAFLTTKVKGSSTVCILNLDNDALRAVNVGDSWFVVIRDGLETVVNGGVDSWETDVPDTLAWRIAQYALDNSKSNELYTPFSRGVLKLDWNTMVGRLMILLSL